MFSSFLLRMEESKLKKTKRINELKNKIEEEEKQKYLQRK